MRKRKGRNTALFLVFCMVLSMMSAIPARAAYDEDIDDVYGLIAVDWLETEWDGEDECDKVRVNEDGYPLDYQEAPISYTDCKEVSMSDLGSALWIDYRDSLADEAEPVLLEDLTVEYFGEEDPRENDDLEPKDGKYATIGSQEFPMTNDQKRDLIMFKPEQKGYYRFSCTQCANDNNKKLIVHVDYPEIGIYSALDPTRGNLYPANSELYEENFNYIGWKGKSDNKIYLNLYNRYHADSMQLTECALYFWDEEGEHELTGNFDGENLTDVDSDSIEDKNITDYMSMTPAEGQNDDWYQITFTEDFSSKDNFRLEINGTRSYDHEDEPQDMGVTLNGSFQPFGLVATEGLSVDWEDDGKIRVGEDDYPVDDANNSIQYTARKEASTSGSALWIDYRDFSSGDKTPVSATDITAIEYSEKDPYDEAFEESNWKSKTDFSNLIDNYSVQTSNDQERKLVLFKPDKEGYYRFTYKNYKDDAEKLIVHVDFPEVGFYSAPNQTMENLYLANDYFWDGNVEDYIGLIEDNGGEKKSEIYVNLYNKDNANSIELTDYTLLSWEWNEDTEEDEEVKLQSGNITDAVPGSEALSYMSVEPMDDDWYKITFKEDLFSKGYFGLQINGKKSYNDENSDQREETFDAYLNGSFRQSGLLYVTCDGEDLYSGEDELTYSGGINPETAELRFGNFTKDQKTGKIKEEDLDLNKETFKIEARRFEEGAEYHDVTTEDCKYEVTADGALKIISYYQQLYRITIGGQSVYAHPCMDAIEFFKTAEYPDDPEKITNRICTVKAYEGKTETVYVLAHMDSTDPFAAVMDKADITVTLENGTEVEDYKDYIEVSPFTKELDENDNGDPIGFSGYEIKITDQVKEDFRIKVAAKSPVIPWWSDELADYEKELLVKFNKRSSLKVATAPKKIDYTEGDKFDPTGMAVELVYEDKTTDPVKIEDCKITPEGALTTKDTSVTVEYLGLKTTQKITVNPKPQETTPQPTTQTPSAAQPSAEGTVLSPQETGEKAEFTVTSDDSADPTVAYKGTTEKKEKSVTIPNAVEVNGVTYKVTSIADNAFKGNKTVTKVTVGSNITSIGKNAFANCKKLKTVTVSKNVTDVGDNAFKGCTALTKVTLPAKTKKIGKNAFSGCKKLKTLTIKSKDLTSKTVSKNAFKGITSKTTIKVPANKLAAYKKLFKKKGLAKNVKVTR